MLSLVKLWDRDIWLVSDLSSSFVVVIKCCACTVYMLGLHLPCLCLNLSHGLIAMRTFHGWDSWSAQLWRRTISPGNQSDEQTQTTCMIYSPVAALAQSFIIFSLNCSHHCSSSCMLPPWCWPAVVLQNCRMSSPLCHSRDCPGNVSHSTHYTWQ